MGFVGHVDGAHNLQVLSQDLASNMIPGMVRGAGTGCFGTDTRRQEIQWLDGWMAGGLRSATCQLS